MPSPFLGLVLIPSQTYLKFTFHAARCLPSPSVKKRIMPITLDPECKRRVFILQVPE